MAHQKINSSIEWRKWINNTAIPTFKFNAVSSTKDMFETVNNYSTKSRWAQRYNFFKYYYVYYKNIFKCLTQYSLLAKNM